MHGRVKVRSSAEEKARKDKERQEKLKAYKHAMQKIFFKRKQDEYDVELLELTGKVLSSNPDICTLWNIRREILIYLRKNEESEELSKLYDSELSLTEYCLKINPKSYCAWHHRQWVLTARPNPDWHKELALCNTYLKLDERNFHTWDYRRFVVSQCKPPLEDEFNYTTEKLHDNFSNYSAWHYRSKMLLELYPDIEGGRPIQDNYHKNELKIVQSAAFTDPDDTSAWFYQRWLLGAVKTITLPVVCAVTPLKCTVAFNKYVSLDYIKDKITLVFNEMEVVGDWIPSSGSDYDDLWVLKHDKQVTDDMDIKLQYILDDNVRQSIYCTKDAPCTYIGKNNISFQNKYSEPVLEELKDQLDSCRQLLALEPDNKWTLLTLNFFLYCIDAKSYHQEIITNLHTLIQVDSQRAGYYNDLISKWNVEQQLLKDYKNNNLHWEVRFNENIQSLPHIQYYSYCISVDLSNQNLTSKILKSLVKLQHCKELNLSDNKLSRLNELPSIPLTKLNLSGNQLCQEELNSFKKGRKLIEIIF